MKVAPSTGRSSNRRGRAARRTARVRRAGRALSGRPGQRRPAERRAVVRRAVSEPRYSRASSRRRRNTPNTRSIEPSSAVAPRPSPVNGSVPDDFGAVDSPATDTVERAVGRRQRRLCRRALADRGHLLLVVLRTGCRLRLGGGRLGVRRVGRGVAEPAERRERAEHEHRDGRAVREARAPVRPRPRCVRGCHASRQAVDELVVCDGPGGPQGLLDRVASPSPEPHPLSLPPPAPRRTP